MNMTTVAGAWCLMLRMLCTHTHTVNTLGCDSCCCYIFIYLCLDVIMSDVSNSVFHGPIVWLKGQKKKQKRNTRLQLIDRHKSSPFAKRKSNAFEDFKICSRHDMRQMKLNSDSMMLLTRTFNRSERKNILSINMLSREMKHAKKKTKIQKEE